MNEKNEQMNMWSVFGNFRSLSIIIISLITIATLGDSVPILEVRRLRLRDTE